MSFQHLKSFPWQLSLLLLGGVFLGGCGQFGEAKTPPTSPPAKNALIAVDTAIAEVGQLKTDIEYTGTTRPVREVSLRAQVEGQVEDLKVDVGDRVESGQLLVRLNDDLLQGSVNQAQAGKTAQNSQVISAKSQVGDAQIKVEQARLQLQQANADILRLESSLQTRIEQARLEAQQTRLDAQRFSTLAKEGAGTAQIAEQSQTKAKQAQQILNNEKVSAEQQISQAKTAAKTAAKILRSAEAQVKIEQQQVAAAIAEVNAQKALITQAKTRQAYATLQSPITGKVLQRSSEQGNLVQPGTEILKLGDFSQIKIALEVSDRQLSNLRPQQRVNVKLDAFPQETWQGRLTRISPAADPQSRLVPLEITLDNPEGKIVSGLLARVSFPQTTTPTLVVPDTALQKDNTLFILQGSGKAKTVVARTITPGEKSNGKVEILAGLALGDEYVVRSSKPLSDGKKVRLSVLSQSESTTN